MKKHPFEPKKWMQPEPHQSDYWLERNFPKLCQYLNYYPMLGPVVVVAFLVITSVGLHWLIGDTASYVIQGIPLVAVVVWIVRKLRAPTED